MNIKEFVFKTKECKLSDLVTAQKSNYDGFEELKEKL